MFKIVFGNKNKLKTEMLVKFFIWLFLHRST